MEANELASELQKTRQTTNHENQVKDCASVLGTRSPTCMAESKGGGFFADQFENLANFRSHYEGTGPEIWEQSGEKLDAFVAAAGTGGTLAGVSRFLKVSILETTKFIVEHLLM